MKKNISFFGSYRIKLDDEEYKVAFKTAFKLAKSGITIINGGGTGIMEASSLGAEEAGGKAIGIVLNEFQKKWPEKGFNDEVIICDSIFERLKKLTENSIGFVIFSGGTGTLSELSLTWELMNKGLFACVPIICYGDFWKPVINTLKKEPSYIKGFCTDYIKFAYSEKEILSFFNL